MGKNNVGRCETENIVALCDVDFTLSEPVFVKYPNARRYKDYRVMLDEQNNIDAVIIATPDHTHAVIAMAAMERKKHIYVQKPLTHSVYEARLLTETARKHGVATQMGNQGHSEKAPASCASGCGAGHRQDPRGARLDQPAGVALGSRGRPAHGNAEVPAGLDWTCGSAPPASAPTTPPITRPSGAPGGISGPARWATWGATSWTRSSGP